MPELESKRYYEAERRLKIAFVRVVRIRFSMALQNLPAFGAIGGPLVRRLIK